jgi:predicted nucleotidyltransferase
MEKKGNMQKSKETIVEIVKQELQKHDEIVFAYLHGSFAEKDVFHDIDIAVFLKELPESKLGYELELETKLIQVIGRIVDVRILNNAPLSFRYHVIKKGVPLLIRDDNERVEFQEFTLSRYFDFAFFRAMYLKETLGLGI